MSRHIAIAAALLLCVAPAATAQQTLSLSECIELAKENNKSILAARHTLEGAGYTERSTKALFLPTISFTGLAAYSSASGSYSSGSGQLPAFSADGNPTGGFAYFPGIDLKYKVNGAFAAGVTLEQPIYMGGKIKAGHAMAQIAQNMASENIRLTEADVILATAQAYASMVKAKELHEVALTYHELLTELMRSVTSAKNHGMKSQNDVYKVQVKLDESSLNILKADNAIRLARMNLCHYIGRSLTDSIEIDGTLPAAADLTSELSISRRPEYTLLKQKEELAEKKVSLARSELLPQIGFVGGVSYTNAVTLNGTRLLNGVSYMVGVKASVPIYDFGYNSNKVKAAKAELRATAQQRADTDELLTLQLAQSRNNLEEAEAEMKLADTSVASAKENMRLSRLNYEKGFETLADYLESQTLYRQALQQQVEARNNHYLAYLNLLHNTGSLN